MTWVSRGETVWILPREDTGTDAHGNPVPTWPEAGSTGAVEVKGAKVAPRTDLAGEAAIADREAVITNKRVLLPPGTRLGALDRMSVRGETYDVIGEPGEWVNPWTSKEVGVEVHLERTEG